MKAPNLNLYSTSHCHLCEQAELILKDLNLTPLTILEIAEDIHLLDLYGLRIPVLQRADTKAELDWPFSALEVISFLQN